MQGSELLAVDDRSEALTGAPRPRTGLVPRLTSATCALVVVLAELLQWWTDNTLVADLCYLGVLVGASAAAWIGVTRWPPARRLTPSLIAAGVSLNAVGEVIWAVLMRTGEDADVSVADVAWFASYVFLCAAVWVVMSRSREGGRADLGFVVDAVTIVVVSVLVFWRFTVDAIVEDTTVSPFARAVWATYPVLDAVLLALVLRALLSRTARAAIGGWFAVGVCLWLAADILYLRLPDNQSAVTTMNAAWMLAPVLMARAAWRVRDGTTGPAAESAAPRRWLGLLLIAVCPLVVPPALELVDDLRDRPNQPWQLLVGMMVVITLALVRTGRLILSEQRAHRELEVARDAALAASHAKSMFLANMSHEIRTPLTTVLVATALLEDTPLDDVQRNLVGKMHRSGERLESLVEGVLDFSRIEAGRAVLQSAEFDLHALVADIADTHLPSAQRQGIAFDWEIDPRVPPAVVGDRTRVFQVLNNLVENAVKFSAQGSVHLDVRPWEEDGDRSGTGVQFSVSDTGIGIDEKDQGSVFESFTQVDGSATRRYQGTGLGLAICKELTELMGGTITVVSELGAGSTFTVRLPLRQAQDTP
jgi:signal transduction histidine kinase